MSDLEVKYDTSNIMLSLGIAFIGSYAAVSLCEQYRLATLSSAQSKRYFVLFLVATSLGWACTWCMHCCSMASIKLRYQGTDIPIRYDRGLIIVAAFQSVIQTYIGLIFSAADPCFNNTRSEIMEKFIARASNTYTLEQIKKMSKLRILFIVCTHSLERLNIGGGFGGAGIALMHYIIMFSMKFQGNVHYSGGIVAASVIFSTINGTGAFWVFFRFLSIFPSLDFLRVIVSIMGVIAVCGMHYIGMAAATFTYDINGSPPNEADTIGQGELYSMAVTSCVIFVIVMLIFTLSDLRAWLLRTSTQLRQADKALTALMKRTTSSNNLNRSNNNSTARTPLEVLRYTRRFLAPDAVGTNTGSSAADHSSGANTAVTHNTHYMYTDYADDEDGSSVDPAAAERSASYRDTREISILRRNHASSSNVVDLENQLVALSPKHKPQPIVVSSSEKTAVGCTLDGVPTDGLGSMSRE